VFWTLNNTITVVNLCLSLFLHTAWWWLIESQNVYMDLGFIPLKYKLCSTDRIICFFLAKNGIYVTFFCILLFLNFVSHWKIHKRFELNVLPPTIISLLYNPGIWYCDRHLRIMYLKTTPSVTFRKWSIFIWTCTIQFSVGKLFWCNFIYIYIYICIYVYTEWFVLKNLLTLQICLRFGTTRIFQCG
jgi:hypothetical protein